MAILVLLECTFYTVKAAILWAELSIIKLWEIETSHVKAAPTNSLHMSTVQYVSVQQNHCGCHAPCIVQPVNQLLRHQIVSD